MFAESPNRFVIFLLRPESDAKSKLTGLPIVTLFRYLFLKAGSKATSHLDHVLSILPPPGEKFFLIEVQYALLAPIQDFQGHLGFQPRILMEKRVRGRQELILI